MSTRSTDFGRRSTIFDFSIAVSLYQCLVSHVMESGESRFNYDPNEKGDNWSLTRLVIHS